MLAAGAGVDGDLLAEVDELHDLLAEQSLAEIQSRLEDGSATNALLDYVVDLFLYELPDIGAPGQGAESGLTGRSELPPRPLAGRRRRATATAACCPSSISSRASPSEAAASCSRSRSPTARPAAGIRPAWIWRAA